MTQELMINPLMKQRKRSLKSEHNMHANPLSRVDELILTQIGV